MSIEVREISKIYDTQRALDNVTFTIPTGEIVGFLGPNGAGKTTMMKILTCFIPPSSGDAFINGHSIYENALEIKKNIGYLPETNPLYYDMYVREYLTFIAGIHKLGKRTKERVNEIIALTGLDKEAHKKIGALSKGYKQRVGLSQALIHNPGVLILDEPTSGLDPNQVIDIRELIKNIGKDKTIMLSTHIMREVEAVCDRVIIINNGKIAADKSINELKELTQQKHYIINIEFEQTVEKKALMQIPQINKAINVKDNIWQLTVGTDKDIRHDIFKWAVSNKLTVLSMTREDASLEEVFHFLTKK